MIPKQSKHDWLSRRELFKAGAIGLAGMGVGGSRVLAQEGEVVAAPPAQAPVESMPQGAGFYRFMVGDLEVGLIADGGFVAPASVFGANQPEEVVAEHARRNFADPAAMQCHIHGLVVKTAEGVVLIDTGCGNNFGPTAGSLVKNLGHFGVKPQEVTTVILTHLHVDHIGGIVGGEGAATFPEAQYVVAGAEVDFWTGEADLSQSSIDPNMWDFFKDLARQSVANAGDRLVRVRPGGEVVPGISTIALPGHTPGHLGVMIDSGGETLLYVSDLMHNAKIQMANPTWHVAFDTDPNQAVQTRQQTLDRVAVEKLMIAGAHLPFPAVGHVRAMGAGYEWEPVAWSW
ncbi:MAG: MBL fold metallo-hydrolase [Phycisphaeraceae bacterium]